MTPASTVLHVTLEFKGGTKSVEGIEVPTEWAGETLHGIVNLRALSKGTVVAGSFVRYPRNHPVVLAYDMVKDWTGPFNHPLQFHGVVLPEYVEINGDSLIPARGLTSSTRSSPPVSSAYIIFGSAPNLRYWRYVVNGLSPMSR